MLTGDPFSPDTWFHLIWDSHGYVLLVETNLFPELVVIFRTLLFEHPLVLSRFCLFLWKTEMFAWLSKIPSLKNNTLMDFWDCKPGKLAYFDETAQHLSCSTCAFKFSERLLIERCIEPRFEFNIIRGSISALNKIALFIKERHSARLLRYQNISNKSPYTSVYSNPALTVRTLWRLPYLVCYSLPLLVYKQTDTCWHNICKLWITSDIAALWYLSSTSQIISENRKL